MINIMQSVYGIYPNSKLIIAINMYSYINTIGSMIDISFKETWPPFFIFKGRF